MRTARQLLDKLAFDAACWAANDKGNKKPSVDQALKEIEGLLLKSLPGKYIYKKVDGKLYQQGWNEALEDTRKAIKSIIGGK